MLREVEKHIKKTLGGIRQAFRAVLSSARNGGPTVQTQGEGLAGEVLQDAELMQHYGLTSMPPAGTMMVVLPIGGKTAHGIVIATEHGSYRLKTLKPGEVALYDDQGQSVILKRGRIMELNTDQLIVNATSKVQITSQDVFIDSPKVRASGEVEAAGDITDLAGAGGKSMAAMRQAHSDHDHQEFDNKGRTGKPNPAA